MPASLLLMGPTEPKHHQHHRERYANPKQVEEYKTQLDQYANQLQNTMAPAMNIWDDATTTMNRLRGAIDTLKFYKTRLGSLDSYLKKFGISRLHEFAVLQRQRRLYSDRVNKLEETRSLGYESQQRANRALFEGLEQQQNAIEDDARQLEPTPVCGHRGSGPDGGHWFTQPARQSAGQPAITYSGTVDRAAECSDDKDAGSDGGRSASAGSDKQAPAKIG